ncbi:serine/threonine-protein kinase [Bifidobacterium biavatii]|uniref:non-specific serine/threonine protein kinase n=1 Tax=Bifidobacterium biavatii DSM 23969 TaxID=1437608 RepID=A0A087A043_9BIFI|nr:serine/threonine-protein kinase [Bifidobacterium biavatii]KFI52143.1 serine/threonine protein kinase [Bifidobacterium biavatii DSM 23969]
MQHGSAASSTITSVQPTGEIPSERPPMLPGCTFIRALGRGSTADVYLYRLHHDDRTVAVKVSRGRLDESTGQRMVVEARALAELGGHPHVLAIHDAGVSSDGRGWLMLAYAPGGSLADLIARHTLGAVQVADWGVRLAGALAAAHRLGIAHRDVKPANVLIDEDGMPMLADFGVAADVYRPGEQTGHSALWAAPEVTDGDRGGDESSDVYSLAATLFAAFAGRSPKVCALPEHMPPVLSDVLVRALSPVADDRPGSAVEFARALQEAQRRMTGRMTPLVVEGSSPFPENTTVAQADAETDARPCKEIGAQPVAHNETRPKAALRPTTPRSIRAVRDTPKRPQAARPSRCRSRSRGRHATVTRRIPGPAISMAMLAMIAMAGMLLAAHNGTDAANTVEHTPSVSVFDTVSVPDDAVDVDVVPTPDRLSGTMQEDAITFTWSNPDPQDGDSYLWSPVDDADGPQEAAMVSIEDTTLTLRGDDAAPCIQVSIMRSNRRASARPAVACATHR